MSTDTRYHRRVKNSGTYEAVEALKEQLRVAQEERDRMKEKSKQARKVADRWDATHRRREAELRSIERTIDEITRSLDILAPEVDEYGIERRLREGSTA